MEDASMDDTCSDDSSVTTLGDTEQSINILAPSPPPKQEQQRSASTPDKNGGEEGLSVLKSPPHPKLPSPATETLDRLSQHDAVGGGDLLLRELRAESSQINDSVDHSAKPNQIYDNPADPDQNRNDAAIREHSGTVVEKKTGLDVLSDAAQSMRGTDGNNQFVEQPSSIPHNGEFHKVSLSQPGRLGMKVIRGVRYHGRETCTVKEVHSGMQAEAAGVQEGDILFRTLETGLKVALTLEDVTDLSKNHPRPVEVLALRVPTDCAQSETTEGATKADAEIDAATEYSIVPFCNRCNNNDAGNNLENHHRLCPKHANFATSGAKDRLDKILEGVKNKCKACDFEYQNGYVNKYKRHTCARALPRKRKRGANNDVTTASYPEEESTSGNWNQPPSVDEDPQVYQKHPFCYRCINVNSNVAHHRLCPKHADFESSGARLKLQKLLQGVKAKCSACEYEYRKGRKKFEKHTCARAVSRRKKTSSKVIACRSSDSIPDESTEGGSSVPGKISQCVRVPTEVRVTPFCLACSGNHGRRDSAPLHHSTYCPKNPHFKSSGAKELLAKIQRSAKNGCEACQYHFQRGKVSSRIRHSANCEMRRGRRKNQQRRNTADSQKVEENREATKSPRSANAARETSSDCRHSVSTNSQLDEVSHAAQANMTGSSTKCLDKNTNFSRDTFSNTITKSSWPQQPAVNCENVITDDSRCSEAAGTDEDVEWVSSYNPWGPTGSADGDELLFCPSGGITDFHDSEERFSLDPFDASSVYCTSHNTPQEGYHVIQLTRDRLATLPWGFRFRRHEFGGACLIESVDLMSPAAAAVHVGLPKNTETRLSSRDAALHANDMLLCVNGKMVGGMNEISLLVELENCGPQALFVVSRSKQNTPMIKAAPTLQNNHAQIHDWVDIEDEQICSPNEDPSTDKPPVVSLTDGSPQPTALNITEANPGQEQCDSLEMKPVSLVSAGDEEASSDNEASPCKSSQPIVNHSNSDGKEEESSVEWDGDAVPWCGCVCGETHEKPVRVFWIQCEGCLAWFNVAAECIGFTKEEAQGMDSWSCEACVGIASPRSKNSAAVTDSEEPDQHAGMSEYELQRLRNIKRNEAKLEALGLLKRDTEPKISRRGKAAKKSLNCSPGVRRKSGRIHAVATQSSESASVGNQLASSPSSPDVFQNVQAVSAHEQGVFETGTVVSVAKRTWPGCNKLGGIGKVARVHNVSEEVLYDIKYVLGTSESKVEAQYVKRHFF